MIEIIPFILIILGWNPAQPEGSMAIQHSLHRDEAACNAAGRALVEQRNAASSEAFPARYTHFCISVPLSEEYDAVFGQPE